MAVSRGQTPPPVNLKERIAALQQRNVSPNTHQSAQAAPRSIPSPGTGALRDRIAKFEGKGGVPVPRGSFAMGVPQLAENAPPKKRGELYGNRVPGLGRPSGLPLSRSGSPHASSDESPGPRKRCISTGTGLSTSPSNFSTDEPVPALPNGLPGLVPRRNSLAVNFGSGRHVMNTGDAEGRDANESSPSFSSLTPDKAIDTTQEQTESPLQEFAAEAIPPEAEEAQPLGLDATENPRLSEPPPAIAQFSLADSGNSRVNSPPKDLPLPEISSVSPCDASQSVSQSSTIAPGGSDDGGSDYESAPQSAVSQQSLSSLPEIASSVSSSVPSDTLPAPPKSTYSGVGTVGATASFPPGKVTNLIAVPRHDTIVTPEPSPTDSLPPSIPSSVQGKPTFRAVVHRKVTELPLTPETATLAPPATVQGTKQRRVGGNVVEVPPSPGHGELAVLLEDAALLELRLTEGDGTSSRAKELLAVTPTSATFQLDPRHASASTLTEHAPMPSVDSGSQSTHSISIPSIREPLFDGDIPEEDETDGRSLASTTFSQRSPSHRKYLSNIYRLGRRSSSYMPGTYPRDSMSMSSEDSSPVTTPSDNGKRKGFGIAWPTSSPKKGGPNVSRSSSFADKIFNRNRTKSNASTADQVSERTSLYQSSQPSLSLAFSSEPSPETQPDGVDIGAHPTSWISPGDSNSEFSPASSFLDKDIFDAFPSVPQTLPPGFHLDVDSSGVGRASTLPVKGRKPVNQRLSIV